LCGRSREEIALPAHRSDFRHAAGVHDDMSAITHDIQDLLADLDQRVRGGLPDWTSDAREAYDAGKLKWDTAAAKMPEALSRAERALGPPNRAAVK
jgi:uncharacterized protein YukE